MIKLVGVVGAGPAGVAASVMLKRYGIEVLLFERRTIGGLLNNAWRVDNFPPLGPASGEDLCKMLKAHLERNKISVMSEEVTDILGRTIVTRKAHYSVDHAVIATGTMPKRLASLEVDSRVVYEYRDIPNGTRTAAVYGAGDMAYDGAIRSKLAGMKALLFARSDKVRAIEALRTTAAKVGVELHMKEPILKVEAGMTCLSITTPLGVYSVEALLICIGREVSLPVISSDRFEIVGDARGDIFRQASIAVGEGIRSAMRIASQR